MILFLIDTTKASKLVGAYHVGIALDSFGAVALGPTEVVEIKLGNTTKEPRLIEPGFHADGLIKVLDRQHIIFIIERRAPYHYQTVSIKLRQAL